MDATNNHFIQAYVMFIYYIYPFMASMAVSPLRCRDDIDGHYFLVQQPSLNCYSGEWMKLLVAFILVLLIWVVGVPALLFFWLKHNRYRLKENRFRSRYGQLYRFYWPHLYWWSIVGVLRKFLILLPVLFTIKVWEAWTASIILFISIFAYGHVKPFQSFQVNQAQFVTNVALYLILYFGILNSYPDTSRGDNIALGVLTTLIVIIAGFYMGRLLYKEIRNNIMNNRVHIAYSGDTPTEQRKVSFEVEHSVQGSTEDNQDDDDDPDEDIDARSTVSDYQNAQNLQASPVI